MSWEVIKDKKKFLTCFTTTGGCNTAVKREGREERRKRNGALGKVNISCLN